MPTVERLAGRRRHGTTTVGAQTSAVKRLARAPMTLPMTNVWRAFAGARFERLLIVAVPVILIAAACMAVVIIDRRADVHREHADRVNEVRVLAAQVSAREWQAVAERRVSDASVREVGDLLEAMRADLGGAVEDTGGGRGALAVLAEYSTAVRAEFAALREGDFEEAEEIDEERVDPTFEALQATVDAVAASEERDAATSSRQGLLGSLLVIVISSSALLAVTLVTLRARNQLALSEVQRATVRESEERLEALLRNSSDVLMVLEPTGSVRFASDSIERLLGHRPDAVAGRDVRELVDEGGREALGAHLEQAISGGRPVVLEWALRTTAGDLRHVEAILNDLSTNPLVDGIVVNVRDITDRRALETELRRRAYHDELTGLANRALFEDRILQALAAADGTGTAAAVLFMDLDDFKHVNDSLGHASGDELLRLVSERLRQCVRDQDTIARLGGDEFAVLLAGIGGVADAVTVADRILKELAAPLMVNGQALFVDASIGVALDPAPGQDGRERLQAVLRDADIAMYAAKGAGKHRVEVFESVLHARIVERLQLKSELQTALDDGQLLLHYQPVVELDNDEIVGVEALVRWQHPQRGLVPPGDFIPLAEQTGLSVPLGRWVLREALRQVSIWHRQRLSGALPYVSVNVSGHQLESSGFVEEVAEALADTGVPASALMIEVTESSLIQDSDRNNATLRGLRDLGVRLAIDDFGTGYSALNYLRRFPMDVLKIDRSFVSGVTANAQEAALVEAMIRMSASLGLSVVAEGVEDGAQCARLQELECGYGQGFLFSKPVPANVLDGVFAGARAVA